MDEKFCQRCGGTPVVCKFCSAVDEKFCKSCHKTLHLEILV